MDFRYPDKPTSSTPESISRLKVEDYICQGKYDGWRCQIYKDCGWHVLTRMGNSLVTHVRAKFSPAILETVKKLDVPEGTVLDGEFVGPRGTHKPAIYLFDCLKWAGRWLGTTSYEKRWEICRGVVLDGKPLSSIASSCPHTDVKLAITFAPEWMTGGLMDAFNHLKQEWLQSGGGADYLFEGIVVKWKQGKLQLDRNASKHSNSQFKLRFRENAIGTRY